MSRIYYYNYFLNISCAILAVAANVLLKKSLDGKFPSWKGDFLAFLNETLFLAFKPMILAGAIFYFSAIALWTFVLSTQKMSVAYPLQIGLVFLFSTLASLMVFGEKLTVSSGAGLVFVMTGVVLISKG
jgi:multidrug transporter EmrE-like cation transporter